jgi:hypothetical protein
LHLLLELITELALRRKIREDEVVELASLLVQIAPAA